MEIDLVLKLFLRMKLLIKCYVLGIDLEILIFFFKIILF